MPPTLPIADIKAAHDEHVDALNALYSIQGGKSFAHWLMNVPDDALMVTDPPPIPYIRRTEASRAAHRLDLAIAVTCYDHFLHLLSTKIIEHVRKASPSWHDTGVTCNDYNLGMAIGPGGARVKTVSGAWNWSVRHPLSARYDLFVPPSVSAAEARRVFADLPDAT